MLHPCQPSVIRTETPSFWRLTSLSFEGHLENKIEYIFGNQWCDVWTIIIIIIDTRHVVHIVQTLEASLQMDR